MTSDSKLLEYPYAETIVRAVSRRGGLTSASAARRSTAEAGRLKRRLLCYPATRSAQLSCAGSKEERQVIDPPTYLSFLIRLWREPTLELPEAAADWQGEVEHIQSGQRWTFSTLDELLGFLRRQAEDPDVLHWPDSADALVHPL
jgi:hypothetical protein